MGGYNHYKTMTCISDIDAPNSVCVSFSVKQWNTFSDPEDRPAQPSRQAAGLHDRCGDEHCRAEPCHRSSARWHRSLTGLPQEFGVLPQELARPATARTRREEKFVIRLAG